MLSPGRWPSVSGCKLLGRFVQPSVPASPFYSPRNFPGFLLSGLRVAERALQRDQSGFKFTSWLCNLDSVLRLSKSRFSLPWEENRGTCLGGELTVGLHVIMNKAPGIVAGTSRSHSGSFSPSLMMFLVHPWISSSGEETQACPGSSCAVPWEDSTVWGTWLGLWTLTQVSEWPRRGSCSHVFLCEAVWIGFCCQCKSRPLFETR